MSVQVSHVQGNAVGSKRAPLVIGKLEDEDDELLAALTVLWIWAEGLDRGYDPDLEEGARRLGPAPNVLVSIARVPSSESRVRSMTLLSTLSLAAFSASL